MAVAHDTGRCTSVKATALGLSEAQEVRKPGESTGCKKTWTGSALLNFVNAAPLAGSVEKEKQNNQLLAQLRVVCWQSLAGAAEPNRTAAAPPSMT